MEAEDLEGLLGEPLEKRVASVISAAMQSGWDPQPVSLVARMSKPGFRPFFMSWALNPETMRFRFSGSRVALVRPDFSGKLTLRDVAVYLEHPEVIEEKEPSSPWTKR